MVDYRKSRKLLIALKASFGAILACLLLSAPALADLIGPALPGTVESSVPAAQPSNITFVQTSLSTPGTVVSAPSAGTITGFNMRIGTVFAPSTLQFWVLRPIGGGFMPVASTAVVPAQANSLNHVSANIPVNAGDHIGISEPAGNDFETPAMDYLGGTISTFLTIPSVGVPLAGGTSQNNSVNRFNADFTPSGGGTSQPGTTPPDTTAPEINLTTPGKKSTYRRLKNISLTTEAGASVELALLRCVGRKCPKSAKASKKSKKGKGKCRALVSKKAKKKGKRRKTFLTFGGKKISCKFDKIKGKSKVMHSVSLSSSGKGTFKLAGKLRGRKNRKGLAKPGKYVLYVQATDAAGNSTVKTKKFGIKSKKKKSSK